MTAVVHYKAEKYSRTTATEAMLNILRARGANRAQSYELYRNLCGTNNLINDRKHVQWKTPSKMLYWYPRGFTSPVLRAAPSDVEYDMLQFGELDKVRMLDLGCGHSPDVLVMRALGFQAWGVDLFDMTSHFRRAKATKGVCADMRKYLIRADLSKPFPFADGSIDVIYCNAMISLIPKEYRMFFWSEVYRILEGSGNMTFSGIDLRHGYGYDLKEEMVRMRTAGFDAPDDCRVGDVITIFKQSL